MTLLLYKKQAAGDLTKLRNVFSNIVKLFRLVLIDNKIPLKTIIVIDD